jgi:hypothetical protein
MGWRYLYITCGTICFVMACVRALVLRTRESPRWLISCGRVHEAIDVLNGISVMNKSGHTVSIESFSPITSGAIQTKSLSENIRRAKRLISGRKNIHLMICLALMWILIGIAYVLLLSFFTQALPKKKEDNGLMASLLPQFHH